jgi:hypothetical protein
MNLASVRAEQSKALHGAWVPPDKHGFEGVHLKVRGRWNPDFRTMEATLAASVLRDGRLPGGELLPAESERIMNECLVETALLDWSGLRESEDSEPLPYSKEKARELLFDPLLRPFRDAVLSAAIMVARDGQDTLEGDLKN